MRTLFLPVGRPDSPQLPHRESHCLEEGGDTVQWQDLDTEYMVKHQVIKRFKRTGGCHKQADTDIDPSHGQPHFVGRIDNRRCFITRLNPPI